MRTKHVVLLDEDGSSTVFNGSSCLGPCVPRTPNDLFTIPRDYLDLAQGNTRYIKLVHDAMVSALTVDMRLFALLFLDTTQRAGLLVTLWLELTCRYYARNTNTMKKKVSSIARPKKKK